LNSEAIAEAVYADPCFVCPESRADGSPSTKAIMILIQVGIRPNSRSVSGDLIATLHHRCNKIRSIVWCSVVNGPTIDLMAGSAIAISPRQQLICKPNLSLF